MLNGHSLEVLAPTLHDVSGDVLDQTMSVITNENLDLGCAVIEQAATEKV